MRTSSSKGIGTMDFRIGAHLVACGPGSKIGESRRQGAEGLGYGLGPAALLCDVDGCHDLYLVDIEARDTRVDDRKTVDEEPDIRCPPGFVAAVAKLPGHGC